MADGPDFGALLSLINSSKGPAAGSSGGAPDKPIYLFGGIRQMINTMVGFANPRKDQPINQLPQKRPGVVGDKVFGSFERAFAAAFEEIKKISKDNMPTQAPMNSGGGPTHFAAASRDVGGDGGPNLG